MAGESSYERGYRHGTEGTPGEPQGGKLGVFSSKLGPLPLWAWLAIITIIALVYYVYSQKKNSNSNSSTSNSTGSDEESSSLIPQFVNQTYTQVLPPSPPNPSNPSQPAPPQQTQTGGQTTTPPTQTTTPPTSTGSSKPPTTSTTTVKTTGKMPAKPSTPSEPIFNGSYTVKKGQTLDQVAKQFGITREQLAHANGLGTGAGLRTGQVLKVPNPAPGGKPNKAQ
jgi:LysM repeat protein